MWPYGEYTTPYSAVTIIYNALLSLVLIRLRIKGEGLPLTQSQRWGLTTLTFLFMFNTAGLSLGIVTKTILITDGDRWIANSFFNLAMDINSLAHLFLLLFGLVYPRPVLPWDKMRPLIFVISALYSGLLIMEIWLTTNGAFTAPGMLVFDIVYTIACFVPIFLWLPQYERQESPQMRMILVLLIWGYLFYFSSSQSGEFMTSVVQVQISDTGLTRAVLVGVVYILLARAMYYRLGSWAGAEKLNAAFMFVTFVFTMVIGSLGIENARSGIYPSAHPVLSIVWFFSYEVGWRIIRPTLFIYGLLRYQFIGRDVRADMEFTNLFALMGSGTLFIVVLFLFAGNDGSGAAIGLVAGLAIAILIFIPLRRFSKGLVGRILPMSSGGGDAPLSERRTTYLLALQTAVVDGELKDKFDSAVLDELRKDLRIADREHELLMAGFEKEKPRTLVQKIEEVYLFHKGGALIGYVTTKKAKTTGIKSDMMVTMFTAVREFSKDALRRKGEQLGAIEYGDTELIIELEGDIALGVILQGRDDPQVRQQMRDVLRKIKDGYIDAIEIATGGRIEDLAKAKQRLASVGSLLKELIYEQEVCRPHDRWAV